MKRKKAQSALQKRRAYKIIFIGGLLLLFMAALLILLFRVAQIKWEHGTDYEHAALAQTGAYSDSSIAALRGNIYAYGGELLAYSEVRYNVIVDPQRFQSDQVSDSVRTTTARILVKTLGLSGEEEVTKYLNPEYKDRRYERLSGGSGIDEATKNELDAAVKAGDIDGIWFEETQNRIYPYHELAAQVLGFQSSYGLDKSYNDYLTGIDGRRLMVADSDGSYNAQITEPVNGSNLVLTLNVSVQKIIEEKLSQAVQTYNCKEACAICMNPQTGAIYAWVNYPSFDLNDITTLYAVSPRYQELLDQNKQLYTSSAWNNFGISYTYQPGSTFKPIAESIALEEQAVATSEVFMCTRNGYTVPGTNYTIRCISNRVHGQLGLNGILMKSCNQCIAQVIERISTERFLKYASDFGLGQLTGIDLPDEVSASGLVYGKDTLGISEKAACGFGQGFNLTPIQLITAFSSVVNGGKIMRPYLVQKVISANGMVEKETVPMQLRTTVSKATSDIIKDYINQTYIGYDFIDVKGYQSKIGCKTGTAEQGVYGTDASIASMVSVAPLDNPQMIMLVIFNHSDNQASSEVGKTVGKILEEILPVLGIYSE